MPKRKTKKKKQMIKDLYLDRPTSHGGWPSGKNRGWIDKRPVNLQIADYLEKMGLLADVPQARLSEEKLRCLVQKLLIEIHTYSS